MQAKLNIVLNIASELGLTLTSESAFKAIELMAETDRLRLSVEDLMEEYSINEDLCDELIHCLNEVKKKRFELAILKSGRSISSRLELKDLKNRGVNNLVDIPIEVRAQVSNFEYQIAQELEYLRAQRRKSKETIVEENNLLPNLNFRVGLSLLLTLFASIFIILGYVASTDERFYDKDFGYWSMLLGGLAFLITLNLLVLRIIQAVRFHMKKQKIIQDLAQKHLNKLAGDFEVSENLIRSKIFDLESVVYIAACKDRFNEVLNEIKEVLFKVRKHFK